MPTLRESLTYEPQELRFGTSGRRGEVIHLTQLEVYINVLAEIEYLKSLPPSSGGIDPYSPFFFGYDFPPSPNKFGRVLGGGEEIGRVLFKAPEDARPPPKCRGPSPPPAATNQTLECVN